LLILIL